MLSRNQVTDKTLQTAGQQKTCETRPALMHPAGWNLVFLVLLGCQSAAALLGIELFLGFFAVYGLIFLYLNFSNDYFRKIQNYISIPFVTIFIVLNYQNLPNFLELNSFDLRLMMLPVFMLVTIAAMYRTTLRCSFSPYQVTRAISWGLLAGTAAFLVGNNHALTHGAETRPVGLLGSPESQPRG